MVLAKRNPSGGRRMMRARLGPDPLNLSIITRSIAPILVPSVLRTGVPSTRSLAITCAGFLSRRAPPQHLPAGSSKAILRVTTKTVVFLPLPTSSSIPSSGPNLTFESREGFPRFWAHASLAHAHRDFHHHYRLSTASAQGVCRRSERTAEACLAGTDRASVGGPRRHGRNHASDGENQDLCLALARTFHGGRNRQVEARGWVGMGRNATRKVGRT